MINATITCSHCGKATKHTMIDNKMYSFAPCECQTVKTETYPICKSCSAVMMDEKEPKKLKAWLWNPYEDKSSGWGLSFYEDEPDDKDTFQYMRAVWLDPPEDLFE